MFTFYAIDHSHACFLGNYSLSVVSPLSSFLIQLLHQLLPCSNNHVQVSNTHVHTHNYTPTHQSRVVRTSYHCRASWGLKNLSPGTYSPTSSLPFLMEGRRLSLLQCTRPADIDHTEIRWQFNRGATPTICLLCWILYMLLGPAGQLLSVLEKPLVKINLCLNPLHFGES